MKMDLVMAGVRPVTFFSGKRKNAVSKILSETRRGIGCKHLGHVAHKRHEKDTATYISVTYPGSWLLNYALRNYSSIDPVISHVNTTSRPIILNDLGLTNPEIKSMNEDARRFGLGQSFVSFAVMPASETPGAVMFAYDMDPSEFGAFVHANYLQLKQAARRLHLDILAARGLLSSDDISFEIDEREEYCLTMLANGRSLADIGIILDTNYDGAREILKGVLQKLGCKNSMQAVSRAISLGLIDADSGATPPPDSFAPKTAVRPLRH